MHIHLRFLLIPVSMLLLPGTLPAEAVAVTSVVFNGYTRELLPDRSFKPERYVFGEGGCWTRPIADPAMAKLTFPQIGRVIAGPLAQLNYQPAFKAADADLLILVFWGSTEGSRNLYWADRVGELDYHGGERAGLDILNARILGYSESLGRAQSAPHMSFARDTLAELGENRYYLVLQAYDFKTAAKVKKLKPLWTTRISVSESGAFAPALEKMAWSASRYYGHDSDGLRRTRVREGTVELGPLQVIEVVSPN